MEFLVYTLEPLDDNRTLDSFEPGVDVEIAKIINKLERMDLERVLNNNTINLLVDNIEYDKDKGIATADIYKQTSPEKALHRLTEEGDEITIREIISEDEDAFEQGLIGLSKIDGEVHLIVEVNYGSFFVSACYGMEIEPLYSSETIRSIQESETIGKTTLDFDEDYELSASLFKPPEDEDIREEQGFGNVNLANKITSLLKISRSHRMSLDIDRDEWLNNIDIFDELIESGIVTKVRVEDTINGIVSLGEGGDRAIRKRLKTTNSGDEAIEEAFANYSQ